MSLIVDLRNVKNPDELIETTPTHGLGFPYDATTSTIILCAMVCNFYGISKENIRDVFERIRTYELICGYVLQNRPISLADLKRRIGIEFNITNSSHQAFWKHMRSLLEAKVQYDWETENKTNA